MSLIPSLLRAIVTVGGQSLVLQAGERPYVSSAAGPIDLSGGGMTADAIAGVISELLPPDAQNVLTQFGAVQHDVGELADFPGEQFRVVATNEGNSLGIEIRRLHPVTPLTAAAAPASPLIATTRRRQADRPDHAPPLVRQADTATGASTESRTALAPPALETSAATVDRLEESAVLDRLLRGAFSQGATSLYLTAGLTPWMRADDDLRVLPGERPLSVAQIEAMLSRAPDGAPLTGEGGREWFWEFPELGRLRCTSVRDRRGPGLVLRVAPVRPATSRQLGLSREIEALAARSDGLIVVAASHLRGAHDLVAALVDVINRTRRAHVISIEREATAMHENDASLVSQREAGRSLDRAVQLARAAMREQPDVLVFDTILTADLLSLALEAAGHGHLVLCAARGHRVAEVLEHMSSLVPPAQRPVTQFALSRVLVGVVTELMDVAANGSSSSRELLVNTAESAHLISEGRFAGLGQPDRRRGSGDSR